MGVTIKQIAEMADVHRSTVDKVIHQREGVSDEVRERVQKIIDDCGYQTNPIGKALKMQDKKLEIGVILLIVDALPYLKNGIENALKQYQSFQISLDFKELVFTDVAGQARMLQYYRNQKKDGIILMPLESPEVLREIDACDQAGIPVVTVNTDIKNSKRMCYVGEDGFKAGKIAGRLMGEFLGGTGKVAVFTSNIDKWQSFSFGNRESGFQKVIWESYSKIALLPSILTSESSHVLYMRVKELLKNEPDVDGIFITAGGVKGAGDALKESGNEKIKLICFENYAEILRLLEEEVVTATLDSKTTEQGMRGFQVLMDFLIYNRKPVRKHLYLENLIMVKESL